MQQTGSQSRGVAVVVGALDNTTALSGVRALAAAGWQAHAVGHGDSRMLRSSRAVRSVHRICAPSEDPTAFVQSVRAALQALDAPVVLMAGDAELVALSSTNDAFLASCGVPDSQVVDAVLDKKRLADAAAEVGLATPQLWAGTEGLPAVVKAALHYKDGRHEGRWEARVVRTSAGLRHAMDEAEAADVPVVVQQFVRGSLMALNLVLDRHGTSIARAQQMTSTIWPRDAGRSARAVTVPVDDKLAAACGQLLAAAGWYGLVQLQFLLPAGGKPVLIDVNPRLYGSVALAVAAGSALPDLAARVVRGEQVPAVPDARPGVRYRWLEGELRAALAGPARGHDLVSALAPARMRVGPVWDARDPLPALVECWNLAGRGLARRRGTNRR